jgi:hypothetical protein
VRVARAASAPQFATEGSHRPETGQERLVAAGVRRGRSYHPR